MIPPTQLGPLWMSDTEGQAASSVRAALPIFTPLRSFSIVQYHVVVRSFSNHSTNPTWTPFDVRYRMARTLLRTHRFVHMYLIKIVIHLEHHRLRHWTGRCGMLGSHGEHLIVVGGNRRGAIWRLPLFAFGVGHRG